LAAVDRIVVAERDRAGFGDGHIQAIAVVHFEELVLWLEVAKFGIGQHGIHSAKARNTMIGKGIKFSCKTLNLKPLYKIDTMTWLSTIAWYRLPIMASMRDHTIKNAMKKYYLTVLIVARQCQTK
jgi:hypothetical protein